ncbi:hypothetical protein BT93_G0319 [Corymbia citriodora subsp. variegata]|nr:hypothetical protein BT93_G0319 [Corymbia citriodora subsp. variegata]
MKECSTVYGASPQKGHAASDPSYAEVQAGEEPRIEQVQQETAAGNINASISLDEAAAREKNGQISITENRRSITESLDRVASTEETDGILWSTFSGPEFSDFSDFEKYFDEPAAQAKGQEQQEHDLDGNSPKRRRLDGDLHWCEGRKPDMAAGSWTPESLTQVALKLQEAVEGFGFSPTEEQLIDYLKTERPGHRRGFCIIPTLEDIYEINPRELPDKFSGKSIIPSNGRGWWFISPQKQNKRVRRKTPSGSWKVTSKSTEIKIDGKPIGFKKILSFPDGRGSKDRRSNCIIHEYCLPDKYHEIQAWMESPRQSTWHQNQGRLSWSYLLQLLQQEQRSQTNSFRSPIHQSKNIGSPFDLSYPKFQMGEEPRFEQVQQETAARNINSRISSNEAAAREKNDQVSITENRQSKIEPLDCGLPIDETEGVEQSTSDDLLLTQLVQCVLEGPAAQEKGLAHSPHLPAILRFLESSNEDAEQTKLPTQEWWQRQAHAEHNSAGDSSKRRRVDGSEENQIK